MDSEDDDDDEEVNNEDTISHNLIEDDDLINTDVKADQEEKANDEKPVVCGALSSLMCDYGTSDDEEMDDSKEQKTNKCDIIQGPEKGNPPKNKLLQVHSAQIEGACKGVSKVIDTISTAGNENGGVKPVIEPLDDKSNTTTEVNNEKYSHDSGKPEMPSSSINNVENGDDDSGPEEIKVEKTDATENMCADAKNKHNKKKVEFVKEKPIYRKPRPKMPSTLLYKLLSNEMKQERNKILQCVRYIIQHDFFDKSTKST